MTKTSSIAVHHALHGYAEGHRELAISRKLSPTDSRTLRTLSDISGQGAKLPENGYLTGYPLVESAVYVIARTWPAREMPRPGCVWTHSILIDFADVALIGDVASVIENFRRPSEADAEFYKAHLNLPLVTKPHQLGDLGDDDYVSRVLQAVYGCPDKRVTVRRPRDASADALVAALWGQQWPRLRRSFRFCTFSATDRSSETAPFDLQFIPEDGHAYRPRFSHTLDADQVKVDAEALWVGPVLADLRKNQDSPLRKFLHRVGSDITHPRSAFVPVCQLYELTRRTGDNGAAKLQALELLSTSFTRSEARAARKFVLASALGDSRLSTKQLRLISNELEELGSEAAAEYLEPLVSQLACDAPELLSDLLSSGPTVSLATFDALVTLEPTKAVSAMVAQPSLAKTLLRAQPQLIAMPSLWSEPRLQDDLWSSYEGGNRSNGLALAALLKANCFELAPLLRRRSAGLEALQALASMDAASEISAKDLQQWIAMLALPEDTAQVLISKPVSTNFLVGVTLGLPPEAMGLIGREDPWYVAICRVWPDVSSSTATLLGAYSFARGASYLSSRQSELLQLSTDALLGATRRGELVGHARSVLERFFLGKLRSGADLEKRIFETVSRVYVQRNLSIDAFSQLVSDGRDFERLVHEAKKVLGGKRYLRDVAEYLAQSPATYLQERRRLIGAALK